LDHQNAPFWALCQNTQVVEEHCPPAHWDVTPDALLRHDAHNLAAALALWTLRAILVQLDVQMELSAAVLEPEITHPKPY
jgi:hypothetical protein